MKRRELLKGLVVAPLAAATVNRSVLAASHEAHEKEHEVEFLLVQNAQGVTLKDGQLRMKGIAPDTLYFSDRPDRIVGRATTKECVDHWAAGGDSFAADPPNAVLSIHQGEVPQDIVVVLRNPRLDSADLIYDVDVLDGEKMASGDSAALFIDVVGRPLTPVSVAGVARRTTRRTVRRVERRR